MNIIKALLLTLTTLSVNTLANDNKIILSHNVDKSGYMSDDWIEPNSKGEKVRVQHLSKEEKKLTAEEAKWAKLIGTRLSTWETQLEKIALPFANIEIPRKLSIVVGTTGGDDAFVYPTKFPNSVFFNVNLMVREYGDGNSATNQQRIDRFFAHEYTHLMQSLWLKENPYQITTHLDRALRATYKEGLAHFHSISTKWKDDNGYITKHGEKALAYLEPLFVDRIISLKSATDNEAKVLMKDLSRGPFHKKWGALTVALWLAKEAQGNDKNLAPWVELGPQGTLVLANKYLSEKLKLKLNREFKIY